MDQPPIKPREHQLNERCWCKPELYYTTPTGGRVWVHHDESGIVPTPKQIAAAIAMAWGVVEEEDQGSLRWKIGEQFGLLALGIAWFFRNLSKWMYPR